MLVQVAVHHPSVQHSFSTGKIGIRVCPIIHRIQERGFGTNRQTYRCRDQAIEQYPSIAFFLRHGALLLFLGCVLLGKRNTKPTLRIAPQYGSQQFHLRRGRRKQFPHHIPKTFEGTFAKQTIVYTALLVYRAQAAGIAKVIDPSGLHCTYGYAFHIAVYRDEKCFGVTLAFQQLLIHWEYFRSGAILSALPEYISAFCYGTFFHTAHPRRKPVPVECVRDTFPLSYRFTDS